MLLALLLADQIVDMQAFLGFPLRAEQARVLGALVQPQVNIFDIHMVLTCDLFEDRLVADQVALKLLPRERTLAGHTSKACQQFVFP